MSQDVQKFLDAKGVEILWNQINLRDYPNNETLIAVLNAIDQTKADKDELNSKANISDIAQSDWNVNDPEDPAYIKNRPFYEDAQVAFTWDGDLDKLEDAIFIEQDGIRAGWCKVSNDPIDFENDTYRMIPVIVTENGAEAGNWSAYIWHKEDAYTSYHEGHGSPYVYSINADSYDIGEGAILTRGIWTVYYNMPDKTIYISSFIGGAEIKTIDPKFLPDELANKEYVDEAISAIPTPDVSGQITTHNADSNSHEDIRQAIETAKIDVKNDLLNGAGEAYDTLKELGELIDENTDALGALEAIAINKADKVDVYTKAEVDAVMPTVIIRNW